MVQFCSLCIYLWMRVCFNKMMCIKIIKSKKRGEETLNLGANKALQTNSLHEDINFCMNLDLKSLLYLLK